MDVAALADMMPILRTFEIDSRPLHRGRKIAVIETELTTDDGRPAAKTTQTPDLPLPESVTPALHHLPAARQAAAVQ